MYSTERKKTVLLILPLPLELYKKLNNELSMSYTMIKNILMTDPNKPDHLNRNAHPESKLIVLYIFMRYAEK